MAPASQPVSPVKQVLVRHEVEYDLSHLEPWREYLVILHNDEEHSQDEVAVQLMKALSCPLDKAWALMLQAQEEGQAVVAMAGGPRALRIAAILRQINLRVSLRQLN